MEDQNASEMGSGRSLETRNEIEMQVETVSTLSTKIHQNKHIWLPMVTFKHAQLIQGLISIAKCTAKARFVRLLKCKNIVQPEPRPYA